MNWNKSPHARPWSLRNREMANFKQERKWFQKEMNCWQWPGKIAVTYDITSTVHKEQTEKSQSSKGNNQQNEKATTYRKNVKIIGKTSLSVKGKAPSTSTTLKSKWITLKTFKWSEETYFKEDIKGQWGGGFKVVHHEPLLWKCNSKPK